MREPTGCALLESEACLSDRIRGLRPAGRGRPLACHAVSGSSPHQVRAGRPVQRRSWSDRECPLDTAGDRSLWHAGGTAGENDDARAWRRRLPARLLGRLVLGDQCLVGRSPKGSRQPRRDSGSDPNLVGPRTEIFPNPIRRFNETICVASKLV
jgi:hypothetical protein